MDSREKRWIRRRNVLDLGLTGCPIAIVSAELRGSAAMAKTISPGEGQENAELFFFVFFHQLVEFLLAFFVRASVTYLIQFMMEFCVI